MNKEVATTQFINNVIDVLLQTRRKGFKDALNSLKDDPTDPHAITYLEDLSRDINRLLRALR